MPKFLFCHEWAASFGAEWSLSKPGLGLPGSTSNAGLQGSEGFRSSVANPYFRGSGRDYLVRCRMVAIGAVDGGGEFGAEWFCSGHGSGLPFSVAIVGSRGIGVGRGVRCQMVVHASDHC